MAISSREKFVKELRMLKVEGDKVFNLLSAKLIRS